MISLTSIKTLANKAPGVSKSWTPSLAILILTTIMPTLAQAADLYDFRGTYVRTQGDPRICKAKYLNVGNDGGNLLIDYLDHEPSADSTPPTVLQRSRMHVINQTLLSANRVSVTKYKSDLSSSILPFSDTITYTISGDFGPITGPWFKEIVTMALSGVDKGEARRGEQGGDLTLRYEYKAYGDYHRFTSGPNRELMSFELECRYHRIQAYRNSLWNLGEKAQTEDDVEFGRGLSHLFFLGID